LLLESRINKYRLFEIQRETVNHDIFYPPTKPTTTRNQFARYAYGWKVKQILSTNIKKPAQPAGFFMPAARWESNKQN
ncbi:hypothetical protein, partial [Providencia alcalifaciens]|uniref:hypothetical protein n=1 Tax=Providencia alcalifaciens TaxID=126385 RepID=UPI002AA0DE7C